MQLVIVIENNIKKCRIKKNINNCDSCHIKDNIEWVDIKRRFTKQMCRLYVAALLTVG